MILTLSNITNLSLNIESILSIWECISKISFVYECYGSLMVMETVISKDLIDKNIYLMKKDLILIIF